jgi:hypothetical protein
VPRDPVAAQAEFKAWCAANHHPVSIHTIHTRHALLSSDSYFIHSLTCVCVSSSLIPPSHLWILSTVDPIYCKSCLQGPWTVQCVLQREREALLAVESLHGRLRYPGDCTGHSSDQEIPPECTRGG